MNSSSELTLPAKLSAFVRVIDQVQMQVVAHDRATGERFNVFTALLAHDDEVRLHTRFLHCLLDPVGCHVCGDIFLQQFFTVLSAIPPIDHESRPCAVNLAGTGKWSVERDIPCGSHGILDLQLSQPGRTVIIENKTRLHEQPEQIARYARYLRTRHGGPDGGSLLFLTPDGSPSVTHDNEPYLRISYRQHILSWIDACLNLPDVGAPVRDAIRQYKQVVEELVGQNPPSAMKKQLVDHIRQHSDLLRYRDTIKEALDEVRVWALEQLTGSVVDGIKARGYTVDSPEGRSFAHNAEGLLIITPPANSPLHGAPFKICLQNWTSKSLLLMGLETSDALASQHAPMFGQMAELLAPAGFTKSGGYSTWPVGWVNLVERFDDAKLADFLSRSSDELWTDLLDQINRRLTAIERAYAQANTHDLGSVPTSPD